MSSSELINEQHEVSHNEEVCNEVCEDEVSQKPDFEQMATDVINNIKNGVLHHYKEVSNTKNEEFILNFKKTFLVQFALIDFLINNLNPHFSLMWSNVSGISAFNHFQIAYLKNSINKLKELKGEEAYKTGFDIAKRSGDEVQLLLNKLINELTKNE